MNRAFSPRNLVDGYSWAVGPGWYVAGLWPSDRGGPPHRVPRERGEGERPFGSQPGVGAKERSPSGSGWGGPKARSVPAWANGPGFLRFQIYRAESPIHARFGRAVSQRPIAQVQIRSAPLANRRSGMNEPGFQPCDFCRIYTWAVGPGWYVAGPLALRSQRSPAPRAAGEGRAKGPFGSPPGVGAKERSPSGSGWEGQRPAPSQPGPTAQVKFDITSQG